MPPKKPDAPKKKKATVDDKVCRPTTKTLIIETTC
jgi:hypothetical protein